MTPRSAPPTQEEDAQILRDLLPNSPLSLAEAARLLLRGLVKASTLRAAADRGELVIEKVGKRIITTPANVEAWRALCRDKAKAGVSHFPRPSSKLSDAAPAKIALASARATLQRLSDGLPPSTGRRDPRRSAGTADERQISDRKSDKVR